MKKLAERQILANELFIASLVKSRLRLGEICRFQRQVKSFAFAHGEIKSTHPPSRRISLPAGQFHHEVISPTRMVDLVENSTCFR